MALTLWPPSYMHTGLWIINKVLVHHSKKEQRPNADAATGQYSDAGLRLTSHSSNDFRVVKCKGTCRVLIPTSLRQTGSRTPGAAPLFTVQCIIQTILSGEPCVYVSWADATWTRLFLQRVINQKKKKKKEVLAESLATGVDLEIRGESVPTLSWRKEKRSPTKMREAAAAAAFCNCAFHCSRSDVQALFLEWCQCWEEIHQKWLFH